ncbi:MAG TPA: LptF/LptG family permease, partial [Xylanibacter oryzae]|nr:LptF/LptG family permease [Xylanibacter oryzae]
SLIFITIIISIGSFFFQNVVGPAANKDFATLLISMKQKSPELEIPEGIFYDGIPQTNIYVQKKDMKTGMLYGVMIYKMNGSYEDAAIILADSGMLRSTAEKKHLLLNLYSGEWFENMQSQQLASSASVPYRRETFESKSIVLDFDSGFNMNDGSLISGDARAKSLSRISRDIDSINCVYDSVGHRFYSDAMRSDYYIPLTSKKDSMKAISETMNGKINIDTVFAHISSEKRQAIINAALNRSEMIYNTLQYKSFTTSDGDKTIREHQIEAINKFTLSLSCLIFFFIGAPLGAIIRKGGLGIPVIISVIVFIIYYIFDNTGFRMARGGMWAVWFGKSIATGVLTPLAIFFTYKANKDSVVFNFDVDRDIMRKLLGLKIQRMVYRKEVIINDPDYATDIIRLEKLSDNATKYSKVHRLFMAPNIIKVFFKYKKDHIIEKLSTEMEEIIEDLSNTNDKIILSELNKYPIVSVKAHTRPFEHQWLNIMSAVIVPLGIFFYLRMWKFRLRLYFDLRTISTTNSNIIERIKELNKK